jgi:hypothetical protein
MSPSLPSGPDSPAPGLIIGPCGRPAAALDWTILGVVWLLALIALSSPAWLWVPGAVLVTGIHTVFLLRGLGFSPLGLTRLAASSYAVVSILAVFAALRTHAAMAVRRAAAPTWSCSTWTSATGSPRNATWPRSSPRDRGSWCCPPRTVRPRSGTRCARAGGYVLKHEDAAGLREAIRTVAAGTDWISPRLAFIFATDDAPDRPALGAQETRTLRLYATGMPIKSVARRLGISEETAKQYVRGSQR